MSKIKVEIDEKYREALDLLKQVIPNEKGENITEDGEMVGALIDSFMAFLQEQADMVEEEGDEGGCCSGGSCKEDDKKEA